MERIKVLSWEKVSLIVPEKEDTKIWYAWVNDIETQSYLGSMYGEIITLEDEEEYYESIRKDTSTKLFCIYTEEFKKVIWNISLMWVDYKNRKAELWIAIFDKESQNKWYGTESIKLMLKYAFEVLWLNKVNLRFVEFNKRAQAVYVKIWFKQVWRLKKEIFINWKLHDYILMEIFAKDFLKQ